MQRISEKVDSPNCLRLTHLSTTQCYMRPTDQIKCARLTLSCTDLVGQLLLSGLRYKRLTKRYILFYPFYLFIFLFLVGFFFPLAGHLLPFDPVVITTLYPLITSNVAQTMYTFSFFLFVSNWFAKKVSSTFRDFG